MGTFKSKLISFTNGHVSMLPKKACFLLINATISLSLLSTKQLMAVGTDICLKICSKFIYYVINLIENILYGNDKYQLTLVLPIWEL